MPINISFAKTIPQIRKRTKTVTRRFAWENLTIGTVLCGVEKGMGLQKGEAVIRLGNIRVINIRRERVDAITPDDVVREGFPNMSVDDFMHKLLLKGAKLKNGEPATPASLCTRIEFEYID